MIIHCVTIVNKSGAEVVGSAEQWSALSNQAAIDNCLHDVSHRATGDYVETLRGWLTSGDDLSIEGLEIPNGFNHTDLWTVEDM